MNQVYIFGHRNPDTDSIASVIGYADFLNRSEPGRYIPARCGEMNAETKYMLERFGLENPAFIPSVESRLSDISFKPVFSLPEDVPAVDAATLMVQERIRNVVITDACGKPAGMIGEHALAAAYLRTIHLAELQVTPIPLGTLARVLDAVTVVSAHTILEGRVYIAIDALHMTLARMTPRDIAIVGDDEPAQLAFVAAGIACLIIAGGAPAGGRVAAEAEKKGVSVLTTPLDAFGIGKMISLLLPAREVMERDIPVLALTEPTSRARQVVAGSKFRAACVVRPDGILAGVLTRTTLLDDVRRPVILLDHNEASQAVDGIGGAEIIEIIDHHRLSPITTLKPIRFLNDPVGATSTIIAMKFLQSGLTPSPAVAGALLCGVLSDTLALRMSTATHHDRKAVEFLACAAGVDPAELGPALLEQGMDLAGITTGEILSRDTKEFGLSGRKVIIAQVMVPSFAWNRERSCDIRESLRTLRDSSRADIAVALFTCVIENASDVYWAGDEDCVRSIFSGDMPLRFGGVMSRKKDFLPWLGERLRDRT